MRYRGQAAAPRGRRGVLWALRLCNNGCADDVCAAAYIRLTLAPSALPATNRTWPGAARPQSDSLLLSFIFIPILIIILITWSSLLRVLSRFFSREPACGECSLLLGLMAYTRH